MGEYKEETMGELRVKLDGASAESEEGGGIRMALRLVPWTQALIGIKDTHLLVCLDSALVSSVLKLRC